MVSSLAFVGGLIVDCQRLKFHIADPMIVLQVKTRSWCYQHSVCLSTTYLPHLSATDKVCVCRLPM